VIKRALATIGTVMRMDRRSDRCLAWIEATITMLAAVALI